MIKNALENIYISPLELCNLDCKLCYTKKTKNILNNDQINSFVERYKKCLRSKNYDLKSALFCGGEVFIMPDFVNLINNLNDKNIFVSVITNGTIDKLDEIKNPNNCQLLVSLDGPKEIHDENRGVGNFNKTIKFINKALKLNFAVEIMFLVTPDSIAFVDSFPEYLSKFINSKTIPINHITQKTIFYTKNHPLSNQNNKHSALTQEQIIKIKQNYTSIPDKNFGCFQVSLQSDGLIYGCCESPTPLSKISDNPETIVDNFLKSLKKCQDCLKCQGCGDPEFFCGYKKELALMSCQEVVKVFNKIK